MIGLSQIPNKQIAVSTSLGPFNSGQIFFAYLQCFNTVSVLQEQNRDFQKATGFYVKNRCLSK